VFSWAAGRCLADKTLNLAGKYTDLAGKPPRTAGKLHKSAGNEFSKTKYYLPPNRILSPPEENDMKKGEIFI
jgi:hypothetical protein